VFAPGSSQGLVSVTVVGRPRSSTATRIPARYGLQSSETRAWIQQVGTPSPSMPRVSITRTLSSSTGAWAAIAASTAWASTAWSGSGRSIWAALRASRARWGPTLTGFPSKAPIVSKTPSPRVATRSVTDSCGTVPSARWNGSPPSAGAAVAPGTRTRTGAGAAGLVVVMSRLLIEGPHGVRGCRSSVDPIRGASASRAVEAGGPDVVPGRGGAAGGRADHVADHLSQPVQERERVLVGGRREPCGVGGAAAQGGSLCDGLRPAGATSVCRPGRRVGPGVGPDRDVRSSCSPGLAAGAGALTGAAAPVGAAPVSAAGGAGRARSAARPGIRTAGALRRVPARRVPIRCGGSVGPAGCGAQQVAEARPGAQALQQGLRRPTRPERPEDDVREPTAQRTAEERTEEGRAALRGREHLTQQLGERTVLTGLLPGGAAEEIPQHGVGAVGQVPQELAGRRPPAATAAEAPSVGSGDGVLL